MNEPSKKAESEAGSDFARQAAGDGSSEEGLVGGLVGMLRENRKWWLAPIVAAVLLLGLLVLLGGTAAAPFIYTLF